MGGGRSWEKLEGQIPPLGGEASGGWAAVALTQGLHLVEAGSIPICELQPEASPLLTVTILPSIPNGLGRDPCLCQG